MSADLQAILAHQTALKACRRCRDMIPPVVTGRPVKSPVLLVGQALGEREGVLGRPFAWTAGKTQFKWFTQIGMREDRFRSRVYMAAVCRCFPGKKASGGDRVPSRVEIANCRPWLTAELALLQTALVIPLGKLAIAQFLEFDRLADVVGAGFEVRIGARTLDVVPLPHPSGASTWHRTESGRSRLAAALDRIASHSAWQSVADAP